MMDVQDDRQSGRRFTKWIKQQNASLWFGVGFLVLASVFFWLSFGLSYKSKLGAGPGMYPRWLAGIAIGVAILYIVQSCTRYPFRFGEHFPGRKELINVASVFVACLVFLALLNHVGFIAAGSLLLFILFVRYYPLWRAIALSVGITLVCHVIFKICFSVPLP